MHIASPPAAPWHGSWACFHFHYRLPPHTTATIHSKLPAPTCHLLALPGAGFPHLLFSGQGRRNDGRWLGRTDRQQQRFFSPIKNIFTCPCLPAFACRQATTTFPTYLPLIIPVPFCRVINLISKSTLHFAHPSSSSIILEMTVHSTPLSLSLFLHLSK